MPTPRSGHGGVVWRGKFFCMGGEGTRRVFGQNEAYDPRTDSWEAYATMLTPRHGMGAAVVADAIHVAGGGPMNGGSFQSSIHEVWVAHVLSDAQPSPTSPRQRARLYSKLLSKPLSLTVARRFSFPALPTVTRRI